MGVNKIVVGMILIVIPIMALMLFFYLAWQSAPRYCWENLNAEKDIILSSLRSCVVKCWSKNNLGLDTATDDCNTISLIVKDKPINKEDIENLEKYVRSYLDPLVENTEYQIKIRYNHTAKEIAFVNVGVCGNKVLEKGEKCEDADMGKCRDNDYSYGLCTTNKRCFSCLCTGDLDCNIQSCTNTMPTKQYPSTNSDWCRYCKLANEKGKCNDQRDNDCDGKTDYEDVNDCPLPPTTTTSKATTTSTIETTTITESTTTTLMLPPPVSDTATCPTPQTNCNAYIQLNVRCQPENNNPCPKLWWQVIYEDFVDINMRLNAMYSDGQVFYNYYNNFGGNMNENCNMKGAKDIQPGYEGVYFIPVPEGSSGRAVSVVVDFRSSISDGCGGIQEWAVARADINIP